MKARLILFPDDETVKSTFDLSPELGYLLAGMKVGVYIEYYNGNVDSIPQTNGVPTFVRASTDMFCSEEELAKACERLGFICFFDDCLVVPDGCRSTKYLLEEAKEYLSGYHC